MNFYLRLTLLCVSTILVSCSEPFNLLDPEKSASLAQNLDFTQITASTDGTEHFANQIIKSFESRNEAEEEALWPSQNSNLMIDFFYNDEANVYLQLWGGDAAGVLDTDNDKTDEGPDWLNVAISTEQVHQDEGLALALSKVSPQLVPTAREKVRVAVIDSGIDYDYAPFTRSLVNIKSDNGDTFRSLDLVSGGEGIDKIGHGSAVASMFFRDVPAEQIELLSYKVTAGASDKISLFHGIVAIYKAGLQKADFINLSWGFVTQNENNKAYLERAINFAMQKGAVVIASAGNQGKNIGQTRRVPSSFDQVLTVSSLDYKPSLSLSKYSNFNDRVVDVATIGSVHLAKDWSNNGTMTASGTSFSAPIVVNALIKERLKIQKSTMSSSERNQAALQAFKNSLELKTQLETKVASGAILQFGTKHLKPFFH